VNPRYHSPVAELDQPDGSVDGRALSDKSEQVVLGILLNHHGDIANLAGQLPESLFADPTHRSIRAVLVDTPAPDPVARGMEVVKASIGNRTFTARGDVAEYVRRLMSVGKGDFGYHARQLREAAAKRDVLEKLTRLQDAVAVDDWTRVAVDLESALTTVTDTRPEAGNLVRLTAAASFTIKGVKWLWKGRIPAGMMTILAGREGIGKSTVSLDIAARLTRGTLEGRYGGRPQNVILCATEDSWEHTIAPRLMAVGADMSRVFHIAIQDENGGYRAITAPGDIAAIEKAIRELQPALMLIDPIMAIIDGRIDTHVQQQVQQGLEPLVKLCERAMMAVVGLIHVNKSTTTDALNSVMGSKAFTSLPRSVLYCIADPSSDDGYLMTHEKCNVGPKVASLTYRLDSVRIDLPPDEVDDGDDPYIFTSRVIWGEEDERKAGDVLAEAAAERSHGSLRKDIKAYLDGKSGVVAAADIVAEFEDVDVTRANIDQTLKRMVKAGEASKPLRGFYQSARSTPKAA
jgi:hypothetical protein